MSTSVELLRSREVSPPEAAKPLDEAVWQAWLAKGRAKDRRSSAARMKAVKWLSIAVLLAAAGLWSLLAPYEIGIRSIVILASIIVMFEALHERRYAAAAGFGALALVYNPVAPLFNFSGEWQRAAVMASALPFFASFIWGNRRTEHND